MRTEKINWLDIRLIDRMVELWCRAIKAPFFDNGDDSEQGGMVALLATTNILNDKAKITDIETRIEIFRNALTASLKAENRRWNGKLNAHLDTDYHPCKMLHEAGKIAGIPSSQFPVKSSVNITREIVQSSLGYGGTYMYHYPLKDGRWLVTSLNGPEISIIIDDVEKHGNRLGFTVEEDSK